MLKVQTNILGRISHWFPSVAKTKWGLSWESILAHLNWEIKHMAPLEPMILGLINAIDMIPRWGKNHLKRLTRPEKSLQVN